MTQPSWLNHLRSWLSKNTHLLVLLVILVLGAYLRFHSLATNPPALSQDEVVNGYDAYSLGHTLRDHHGKFLPLTFGSFGDSASVALTYLTVPFVVIGGLSEFTVRLPIALTGIGSILLMYLFLKELRSNKKLALLGAFITAIVPWNITLTRWAVPPCIVPFFCLLFLWLFVKSFGAKNSKSRLGWLAATGLAAALLTYSYPSAEIITPLLVLAAGLTYYYKRWADLLSLYISYGLAVLPLFYLIIFEPASNFARFNAVHISGTPAQIIRQVATNYAGYFVPSFYFGAKGKNPIMHMPGAGNFYAFFGILALAAAALFTIRLIRSGKPLVKLGHYLKNPPVLRGLTFSLLWILLAPIPAALSVDQQHVTRAILLFPIITVLLTFAAYYLVTNWELKHVRLGLSGLLVILSLQQTYHYSRLYSQTYPAKSAASFQYGIKQGVEYALDHQNNYRRVVIDRSINQPYIYYLFYSHYRPRLLNYAEINVFKDLPGPYIMPAIGKYQFNVVSNKDVDAAKKLKTIQKFNRTWFTLYDDGHGSLIMKKN